MSKSVTRRRFLGAVGGAAVLATAPVWLRSGVLPIKRGDTGTGLMQCHA